MQDATQGQEVPSIVTFQEIKKQALIDALEACAGNRTRASERLQISIRTVRNWISEFKLAEEYPPGGGA